MPIGTPIATASPNPAAATEAVAATCGQMLPSPTISTNFAAIRLGLEANSSGTKPVREAISQIPRNAASAPMRSAWISAVRLMMAPAAAGSEISGEVSAIRSIARSGRGGRRKRHHAYAGRPRLDRLVHDGLALAAIERPGERDPAQQLEGARARGRKIGARIARQPPDLAARHRGQELAIELDVDHAVIALARIVREAAGGDEADAPRRARRHLADYAAEGETAFDRGLRRRQRVEEDRHDRAVHAGSEEMQRHHGAVIEFELVRKAGLDALLVARLQELGREPRVALDLGLVDLEPRLDRPPIGGGAADAEGADMVEKEVRPMLRGEQDQHFGAAGVELAREPREAGIDAMPLRGWGRIGPGRHAGRMAHRAGEADHPGSP